MIKQYLQEMVWDRLHQFNSYSNTIKGNLKIRIMLIELGFVLAIILLALGYFSFATNKEMEDLSHFQPRHQVFYATGIALESVLDQLMDNSLLTIINDILAVSTFHPEANICQLGNITSCNKTKQLEVGSLYLGNSIYEVFGEMTSDGWSRTVQINEMCLFILDWMQQNHSDKYEYVIIVNEKDRVVHQFPVVSNHLNVSWLTDKRTGVELKLQNETIGYIYGKLNAKQFQRFIEGFSNGYHYRLEAADFMVQNGNQADLCECALNETCPRYPSPYYEHVYSAAKCQLLFVKSVSYRDIRIVIYSASDLRESGFFTIVTLQWPFFTVFSLFSLISLVVVNHYINLFARDITNPIKQITLKLDKIIQNVFQSKIFDKIQSDDILIKEETEVQELAREFASLFQKLKDEETFSNEIVGSIDQSYSKPKEILIKQQDKSMDQIKQIVSKFGKEQ